MLPSRMPVRLRRVTALIILAAALALPVAALPAWGGTAASEPAAAMPAAARPEPSVTRMPAVLLQSPSPLTIDQCLAKVKIRCYTPVQYRVAYDLNPLYQAGITGKGRTIVIVDSFGSPTIRQDLSFFDRQWGFPDPALDIIKVGNVPQFDANNAVMDGWAEETSLDVEYAHAVAPDAHIVLVETPVAEDEGVTGFPPAMSEEKTLIDGGIGDVISMSFGATENTFPGFAKHSYSSLLNLRYALADAASHGVTVVAAAGDTGATGDEPNGTTLYPYRAVSWPSSDPLVTSVGGTELYLAQNGSRTQPDQVWNDGSYGAGGGGVSAIFGRPAFQNGVRGVVGGYRGTPDISMTAAVNGGGWVYQSFEPTGPGWEVFGGTSESTPMFSGIVALADQMAGRRLGDINSALYALGAQSGSGSFPGGTGIIDITAGSNSFGSITGYSAVPGYDLASGWGTIDAAQFVPALAHLGSRS